MRLPTFYEQNLIPNWGKYGCADNAFAIGIFDNSLTDITLFDNLSPQGRVVKERINLHPTQ